MDSHTVSVIIAAALAVSEALSLIPAFKSNGILQSIITFLGNIGKA